MPHTKFPCLTCQKEVRDNHDAILCVYCKKWAHFTCSCASADTFNSEIDWICNLCIFKELPTYICESDVRKPKENSPKFEYDDVDHIFNKLNRICGITIAHLNVSSLIKNFDEIQQILAKTNIHIFSLCETRLDG